MTARRDEGSIGMAMLITIIAVGMSAALAVIVGSSVADTRADVQTLRAIDAAHAGLNAGLARVMKLGVAPLATGSPAASCVLTGDSASGRYRVLLGFYATAPNPAADPVAADCVFDPTTRRYAAIVASGSDGKGGTTRTLTATYVFPVGSATRGPGGSLVVPGAGGDTCLTTALTLAACNPGSAAQTFLYGSDLTLSQIDTATLRLSCVQAGASTLSMQLCAANTTAQQWYFNGRTFTNASGSACLDVVGGAVVLGTGTRCTATTGTTPTWRPDAEVGSGWAAYKNSQELVSGTGFSRCLTTTTTLGVCGQNSSVPGNTAPWILTPVAGTSYVTIGNGSTCLATTTTANTVTVATCSSASANQRWTAPAVADSWEHSFQIATSGGLCLTAVPSGTDPYSGTVSTGACDGSAAQKWNVDWNAFRSGLTSVGER